MISINKILIFILLISVILCLHGIWGFNFKHDTTSVSYLGLGLDPLPLE